jgi:DNA-binding protein HU-beta
MRGAAAVADSDSRDAKSLDGLRLFAQRALKSAKTMVFHASKFTTDANELQSIARKSLYPNLATPTATRRARTLHPTVNHPQKDSPPMAKKAAPIKAAKAPVKAAKAAKTAAKSTVKAPTVTLRHIGADLAEAHSLPKKQAYTLLEDLVGMLTKHLKKGDRIRMSGLGILQVRKRPARMGRNPATGEAIKIKASKKIAFRAAKELKLAV